MTLQQQIEVELKHMGLKLADIQGELRKRHDFIYNLRVIFVKHFSLKGYSLREIADVLKIHHSTVARLKVVYIEPIKESDVVLNKHSTASQNIRRMKRYLKIEHYVE